MKNLKESKAITLIALIITIIVLLILAGVVINMTLGNDGIISKAQGVVDAYKNAQEKEEWELAKVADEMDGYVDGNRDYATEIKKLQDRITELEKENNHEYWTTVTLPFTAPRDGELYIRFDTGNGDYYITLQGTLGDGSILYDKFGKGIDGWTDNFIIPVTKGETISLYMNSNIKAIRGYYFK